MRNRVVLLACIVFLLAPFCGPGPSGNVFHMEFQVAQEEGPTIDHPDDVTVRLGEQWPGGIEIVWTPNDTDLATYDVVVEGDMGYNMDWIGFTWEGNPIRYNVYIDDHQSSPAVYVCTITVYDEAENSVSDVVSVNIIDDMEPFIEIWYDGDLCGNGSTTLLESSSPETSFTWRIYDNSLPIACLAMLDGVLFIDAVYDSQMWEFTINMSALQVGTHHYFLSASDSSNNTSPCHLFFDVYDATAPVWVNPPVDKLVEVGNTFRYGLESSDPSGISSWWLNDTVNFSVDEDGVITNATSLLVGLYGIRVNVTDTYDHILSGTFNVLFRDSTKPAWCETPSDQTVEFGDTFVCDLNATDLLGISSWGLNDTANYFVTDDGVITTRLFLPVGIYGLEVSVTDTQDNTLTASFTVTVRDTTSPTWVQQPVDRTVVVGIAFIYDLNASDLSGIAGWWVNDTIRFQIDELGVLRNNMVLPVGVYGVRVNVIDNEGNTLTATFTISVIEGTTTSTTTTTTASVTTTTPTTTTTSATSNTTPTTTIVTTGFEGIILLSIVLGGFGAILILVILRRRP